MGGKKENWFLGEKLNEGDEIYTYKNIYRYCLYLGLGPVTTFKFEFDFLTVHKSRVFGISDTNFLSLFKVPWDAAVNTLVLKTMKMYESVEGTSQTIFLKFHLLTRNSKLQVGI